MIVTAVLAIRDEAPYLANCLRHLVANDVRFAILDNDSTDGSCEIWRRSEFSRHLVEARRLPFTGAFSLRDQLRAKMAFVEELQTDWVIHLDADEVMHSRREGETLNAALTRLDGGGWNAANFEEFVFLPLDADYAPDIGGPQPISLYYFFKGGAPRLMRAWRKAEGLSSVENAGHLLSGPALRLAPEPLALRHYMVRSQAHAFQKYAARVFAREELEIGWHQARAGRPASDFRLPSAGRLKRLSHPCERALDRSDPWPTHFWVRPGPAAPEEG